MNSFKSVGDEQIMSDLLLNKTERDMKALHRFIVLKTLMSSCQSERLLSSSVKISNLVQQLDLMLSEDELIAHPPK